MTMKALVKKEPGFGNLEIVEVEEPQVGRDQVKILVKYAGICGSDIHTCANEAEPIGSGSIHSKLCSPSGSSSSSTNAI